MDGLGFCSSEGKNLFCESEETNEVIRDFAAESFWCWRIGGRREKRSEGHDEREGKRERESLWRERRV